MQRVSNKSRNEILAAIADDAFLADLGFPRIGITGQAPDVMNHLVAAIGEVAASNSEIYGVVAEQIEREGLVGLRTKLGPAVARDLADYDPRHASGPDKGRQRLYWLLVAMADRSITNGEVDLQDTLRRASDESQRNYRSFYRRIAKIARREPVAGNDDDGFRHLQAVISVFLEGTEAAWRYGSRLPDEDAVTAILALFYVFTRLPGQPAFDPEQALVSEASNAAPITRGVVEADGEEESYRLAAEALRSLLGDEPDVIRHASIHGISGVGRDSGARPPAAAELRGAMTDLLKAGWRLHRLVTVHSEADLEREREEASHLQNYGKVRVHATVGGVGGHAAIIGGDRFVVLGLDDPHTSYVERAVLSADDPTVRFWIENLDRTFNDQRNAFVIAGPAGPDRSGIAELRRRVNGLVRLLGYDATAVRLTPKQAKIVQYIGDYPDCQIRDIAEDLVIANDTAHKHMRNLYEGYGIPRVGKGEDRFGLLKLELQRRGEI